MGVDAMQRYAHGVVVGLVCLVHQVMWAAEGVACLRGGGSRWSNRDESWCVVYVCAWCACVRVFWIGLDWQMR